ncbi:hypothetical protein PPACK8108_LOCUS21497 [Phakopsora pachyrhizi]|uniref:Hexosyltransferase n=1 Tax=Phakopsora pachyrhizi TaxID=170000 RepID=A0AAV0BHU6_PHAPC|nr:hypothetical protein PPACK8108_LOCUS21497 [Phakopsora pachyrhizi]
MIRSKNNPFSPSSLLIILFVIAIIYSVLIIILDKPYQLNLDPTINPITFQIDRLLSDPSRGKGVVPQAVQRQTAEEEAKLRLAIQLAIHQNLTSPSTRLSNQTKTNRKKQRIDSKRIRQSVGLQLNDTWYSSDENLLSNGPASRFNCQTSSRTLIFLGIFTTPSAFEKRQMIRTILKPDIPPPASSITGSEEGSLIEFKFISGEPENENWKLLIQTENSLNGNDTLILDGVKDNIDQGKTFEYLRSIVDRYRSDERRDRPKFVIKSDDDTFLVIPNLIKSFKDLDCRELIYWGTSKGSSKLFKPYFRGLAYGLSWPLVEWIGSSKMKNETKMGIEDARVGSWMIDLGEELKRIDEGGLMGDWNQVEIDEAVVALHWLKITEWFPMVKLKVLKAWESKGMKYSWDYYL